MAYDGWIYYEDGDLGYEDYVKQIQANAIAQLEYELDEFLADPNYSDEENAENAMNIFMAATGVAGGRLGVEALRRLSPALFTTQLGRTGLAGGTIGSSADAFMQWWSDGSITDPMSLGISFVQGYIIAISTGAGAVSSTIGRPFLGGALAVIAAGQLPDAETTTFDAAGVRHDSDLYPSTADNITNYHASGDILIYLQQHTPLPEALGNNVPVGNPHWDEYYDRALPTLAKRQTRIIGIMALYRGYNQHMMSEILRHSYYAEQLTEERRELYRSHRYGTSD